MGRPPCCEKGGVKKGPWTPEEDLVLVSYVQEHGPGNWRAVPTNTVSDSSYVPVRVWAAIASYLPERTDNDIKNYWNTHLKKKLAKMGGAAAAAGESTAADAKTTRSAAAPKGQWERRLQTDIHTARQALRDALSLDPSSSSSPPLAPPPPPVIKPESAAQPAQPTYASSAENIARLLEGWMRPSGNGNKASSGGSGSSASAVSGGEGASAASHHSGAARTPEGSTGTSGGKPGAAPPGPAFSMLESWLLDDGMGHGETGIMGVPLADPCDFF
ncbi:hypothetical protein PR202_gb03087 [Eleusine coracana subsp. coracana]|uniref:Uncharacterized protein n=1 Tax=Eleusine coracana subsp. coracana TaxID=191504 RepID=A0AAV5E0H3_ELECO|nr:hypothetical protein PR202_gb03087 [Eleusine coracana subsp. coracana]